MNKVAPSSTDGALTVLTSRSLLGLGFSTSGFLSTRGDRETQSTLAHYQEEGGAADRLSCRGGLIGEMLSRATPVSAIERFGKHGEKRPGMNHGAVRGIACGDKRGRTPFQQNDAGGGERVETTRWLWMTGERKMIWKGLL